MGMVKRDSKSIRKLIQPHPSRYDAVVVKLKNVKPKWKVKPYYDDKKNPAGCDIIYDFEPSGDIDKIVTAKELMQLCNKNAIHHRRLWPSVVEIAIAKAMKANFISFNKMNYTELGQCEDFVRQGYALKVTDFYIKLLKDVGNKISPDEEKFYRETMLQGSLTDKELEDYVEKTFPEEFRDERKKT